MQLSFDKASEMHTLQVKCQVNEVTQTDTVSVHAENKSGLLIASGGIQITSIAAGELLPMLFAEIAYGWLYGGSREAVTQPLAKYRIQRREAEQRLHL